MTTRIVIRNMEAADKAGETVQEAVIVKRTGGGPAQTQTLTPGGEVEVTLDGDQKVQIANASEGE